MMMWRRIQENRQELDNSNHTHCLLKILLKAFIVLAILLYKFKLQSNSVSLHAVLKYTIAIFDREKCFAFMTFSKGDFFQTLTNLFYCVALEI